jgi:uncharacterized protein with NRDE domain
VCLLVVAWQLVEDEPLIVGANRDEVLDRPSTAVTVLDPGPPRVVGGRDELSGGTWLAVNQHGVCAGLTNQPLGDAKDPTRRSRGELPLALTGHETATAGVDHLLERFSPSAYNGSWLLVGDRSSLYFVDFTGDGPGTAEALPPGLHVLENRAYGEPSGKVDLVRVALGEPAGADDMVGGFRNVLADHRLPDGDERPNAANCVHLESFGTRSSCIVRVPRAELGMPQVWVADGPPCVTVYEDVTALWTVAQSRTSGL